MIRLFNRHKKTLEDVFWRGLQLVGQQGLTFLIFILCAKLLSPYEFGTYSYVVAIIFFLIMFGDFGISTATSKYVAEYNVTNKDKLKSVLFNSGIIILGLTALITILTLIIGPSYLKDKYVYVLYLLPLIFLAPMTSLYDGIYRGLKKFKSLAIISLIVGLLSLSFVYYFVKVYGLIGALIAQNLFYLILLIGLGLGYKEFHFKLNKEVMKEIGKYSIILGIVGVGYFLFTRINILILGYFNLIIETGQYEMINKILLILILPFTVIAQIMAPRITKLNSKSEMIQIRAKFKSLILFTTCSSLLMAGLMYFIFPMMIKQFLTDYYTPTIIMAFSILLPTLVTQSISTIGAVAFSTAMGYARINMYFLLIFGIANIPTSLVLVHFFGFMGIIYSTLIIKSISDILFILVLFKKIR